MYWICDVRWFPSVVVIVTYAKAQTLGLEWVIGRGLQLLLESGFTDSPVTHESQDFEPPKVYH